MVYSPFYKYYFIRLSIRISSAFLQFAKVMILDGTCIIFGERLASVIKIKAFTLTTPMLTSKTG